MLPLFVLLSTDVDKVPWLEALWELFFAGIDIADDIELEFDEVFDSIPKANASEALRWLLRSVSKYSARWKWEPMVDFLRVEGWHVLKKIIRSEISFNLEMYTKMKAYELTDGRWDCALKTFSSYWS